jgi:hypothetical protein
MQLAVSREEVGGWRLEATNLLSKKHHLPPTSSEGEQVEPERSSNLQPSNPIPHASFAFSQFAIRNSKLIFRNSKSEIRNSKLPPHPFISTFTL